jgi:hypothetical protein
MQKYHGVYQLFSENKVNRMQVQLEFADKQVRDFRQKLDEAGSALLGDNTEFLKMKKESDVSLMGKKSIAFMYFRKPFIKRYANITLEIHLHI